MNYIVKYYSPTRIRIEVPFHCSEAVQYYLEEVSRRYPQIQRLHFYKDSRHIGIFFERGQETVVTEFFKQLDMTVIREKQDFEMIRQTTTPYDIISTHIYRKLLISTLIPQPFRMGWLLWRATRFGKEAFQSIVKRKLSMSLLDFVAIVTSIMMGDHRTADTIMFLLNLGDDLDAWSQKKSIEDLEKNLTNTIYDLWLEKEGERIKVSSHDVNVGDVFVATEGQEIVFDGIVREGKGYLNESSLTGEAFPIEKTVGDAVFANTVVEHGELLIEVTNATQNSRLQQIVQLIKTSEIHQSRQQKQLMERADKLVKYNFIGMMVTYLLTRSISKALTFLLVDYSCALKLSSPVTYLTAIKAASTQNVVIKGSSSLDSFQTIDIFVFDKTGTLTTGVPKIQRILPYAGYTQEDVLQIAACLEEHIYHPIATAVVKEAEAEGIIHEEMHGKLTHVASKGILSSIDGEKVVIGSRSLMHDEGIHITAEQEVVIEEQSHAYNLLYLGYKQQLIAIFLIDTPLRPETLEVVNRLHLQGKKIILLTGDTQKRTENIQKILSFDEVYTEVSPHEKHHVIQQLKDRGHHVLMIGDGINDSAALSLADIGVVMGNSSDIARQASDIIFLGDSLSGIDVLFDVTSKLQMQLDRNLKTTVGVNSALMALGLFEVVSPSVLAVFHNLTTTAIIGKSFTYVK